jgi:hypothetical protein
LEVQEQQLFEEKEQVWKTVKRFEKVIEKNNDLIGKKDK